MQVKVINVKRAINVHALNTVRLCTICNYVQYVHRDGVER